MSENTELPGLIQFLIEATKDVQSPVSIKHLAKGFKNRSGGSETIDCLNKRILRVRSNIYKLEYRDTSTKVKLMFALSASVNPEYLKELQTVATVEIDEKKRITFYQSNDGSLQLTGDHSQSTKRKAVSAGSEHCSRRVIADFFNGIECSGDNDSRYKKEMVALIKYVTTRCGNIISPINMRQLMKDFHSHSGTSTPRTTLEGKIYAYRREIQNIDKMDVVSKVKQLFGLSVLLNPDCLEELRKDASVEVDENNIITHYKANDGSLELKGDHSLLTKQKAGYDVSEHCHRKHIADFFNGIDCEGDNGNKLKTEINNLIKFVFKKCENIESPLSIRQLMKEFKNHSGTSRASITLRRRIKAYRREIQLIDKLDHVSKVKQLFGLSAPLNAECLKELRRTALVDVDNRNRIAEYKSDDGKLHLQGKHSSYDKGQAQRALKIVKSTKGSYSDDKDDESTDDETSDESDEDSEDDEESDEDTDEETDRESCEESDSEISSTVRDDPECSMEPVHPVDDSFGMDYNPPMQNQEESMEVEMNEDKENESDAGDTTEEESTVKTRYGRSSRRRHLDSDFSYTSSNSHATSAVAGDNTRGSELPRNAKKKKRVESRGRAPTPLGSISNYLDTYSSRNLRRSTRISAPPDKRDSLDEPMNNQVIPGDDQDIFDYNGPMIQEMESDDNNQNFIDLEDPPEDCNDTSDSVQEGAPVEEVKPPTEVEEAQNTVENEVKQENQESGTSQELNGNDFVPLPSHIRLLEALQTIMITRNVPDLQEHQARIEKTIEKFREKGIEEEKITINEIRTSLMTTLLIVNKGARKEVIKGEETTSLKEFLIAFYGFVVHVNLKALDNFSNRLKAMMEELTEEDKKFPIKNASIGLQSILVVVAP